MSYGFQLFNDQGYSILDSDDHPYLFVARGLPYTGKPWEIDLSPEGLVTLDWRSVIANPHKASRPIKPGEREYGSAFAVTRLSSTRVRVELSQGNGTEKLWAIDKVPPKGDTGYGLEVYSETGSRVLSSAEPLAKIKNFSTVTVSVNTKIAGNPATDLLFMHSYPFYYRSYGLLGPWYMEHNIYPYVGIDPQGRFSASNIEITQYENPRGYGYDPVRIALSAMIVEKPK